MVVAGATNNILNDNSNMVNTLPYKAGVYMIPLALTDAGNGGICGC